MREKQEDYANIIIEAMPGLLVTVDYDLNIIQMNKAANDLFDISRKKQLLGKAVGEIMDDYPIINMIAFNREIVQDCIYLNEQKRYIERVLTNDRKNKLILCIMKDVTREKESEKKQNRAKQRQFRWQINWRRNSFGSCMRSPVFWEKRQQIPKWLLKS